MGFIGGLEETAWGHTQLPSRFSEAFLTLLECRILQEWHMLLFHLNSFPCSSADTYQCLWNLSSNITEWMTTICSSCGDLLWSPLEIRLHLLCTVGSGERGRSHNPEGSGVGGDGHLKDTWSSAGFLPMGLIVGALSCTSVLATLPIFVLYKN